MPYYFTSIVAVAFVAIVLLVSILTAVDSNKIKDDAIDGSLNPDANVSEKEEDKKEEEKEDEKTEGDESKGDENTEDDKNTTEEE